MKDQYNNEVPSDLVLLENNWLEWLKEEEVKKINQLSWYKVAAQYFTKFIFVSATELEKCIDGLVDFSTSKDVMDKEQNELDWVYVDGVLHRSNISDGWYHN